ncbi:hypothetical protein BKA61DRAFT_596136 [Leptodontidium sp. MPI-SDFR-AT-0119]|nr:hypothetical protein BKA61DRAFT_596136 [Leptodontidium sp. MPI-SDFR-AT-0119]
MKNLSTSSDTTSTHAVRGSVRRSTRNSARLAALPTGLAADVETIARSVKVSENSSANGSAGVSTALSADTGVVEPQLDTFTCYPRLPLELRNMIVKKALPASAIIVLDIETMNWKKPPHNHKVRTLRFILMLDGKMTITEFHESRKLSFLRVDRATREVYTKRFPHSIEISYNRRQRIESRLWISLDDLLYVRNFCGSITLDRTFDSVKNTRPGALPFGYLTRLALGGHVLAKLSDDVVSPGAVKNFLEMCPNLKELKILDHKVPALKGFKKFGARGYQGLNPYPESTNLKSVQSWDVQVDLLFNMMAADPAVVAGKASVPTITFM